MKALLTPALIALTFGLTTPVMAQTNHNMYGMPAAKPVAAGMAASADADALGRLLRTRVHTINGVVATNTLPVLATYKETARILIP
jgi:hypothetical protein